MTKVQQKYQRNLVSWKSNCHPLYRVPSTNLRGVFRHIYIYMYFDLANCDKLWLTHELLNLIRHISAYLEDAMPGSLHRKIMPCASKNSPTQNSKITFAIKHWHNLTKLAATKSSLFLLGNMSILWWWDSQTITILKAPFSLLKVDRSYWGKADLGRGILGVQGFSLIPRELHGVGVFFWE